MTKTVGIGITGGIAAYKITDLVNKLKSNNFEVVVIMTEGATQFITPFTFRTLTDREVITDLWSGPKEWKVKHIGLAEELDLLVIAPATANFIAKMANGIADDFLSTAVVANKSPLLVVPSMNKTMLEDPVVHRNIRILLEYGYHIMESDCGFLADGTIGKGRLPEIDAIYTEIIRILAIK